MNDASLLSEKVITPENVEIGYELAGIASRGLAVLIDLSLYLLGLVSIYLLIVFFILMAFGTLPAYTTFWFVAFLFILAFLVHWGYFVFFETLYQGQTPGKKLMKIRVVQDGGYPLTFTSSVIRNLIRAVDAFPVYGIGILFVLLNPHQKRLGDLAAGTIVVKERKETLPVIPSFPSPSHTLNFRFPLTPPEMELIRSFFSRRSALPPDRRHQIAALLLNRLIHKYGEQVILPGKSSPEEVLEGLLIQRTDGY